MRWGQSSLLWFFLHYPRGGGSFFAPELPVVMVSNYPTDSNPRDDDPGHGFWSAGSAHMPMLVYPEYFMKFFCEIKFMSIYRRYKRYSRCVFPVTVCNLRRFPGTQKKFTLRARPRCPLAALSGACGSRSTAAPLMPCP